jgi:hypothetical protein
MRILLKLSHKSGATEKELFLMERRKQKPTPQRRTSKQTLENKRFTGSPYRARGDEKQVIRARDHLTAMLEAMTEQAKEISFDGVLVSAARMKGEESA